MGGNQSAKTTSLTHIARVGNDIDKVCEREEKDKGIENIDLKNTTI